MRRVTLLLAASLIVAVTLGSAAQLPVPIVRRDSRQPASVFTRPELVVLGSIRDKSQSELTNVEGEHLYGVQRLAIVRLDGVLRVNERLASRPDLSDRHLVVDLGRAGLDLSVGKTYILMVDFLPGGPTWPWASQSPPSYALASKDPGFEIDANNTARPLKRSAGLLAYEGKSFKDVVDAIKRGR
jgi:hypothetical protein